MSTLRNLGIVSIAIALGFACKARTQDPAPAETAAPSQKHHQDQPKADDPTTDDEGTWEPKPVGGVGGGPSEEPSAQPTVKPVAKPTAKPKTPAPSAKPSSAPSAWTPWIPPSGYQWPQWPWGAAPSASAPGSSAPKPTATPQPSATPQWPWTYPSASTNSGGWKAGE
jgi:hypothetical protein